MYRFLTKNGTMLAFGVGLLLTLVFLFSVMGGVEEFNMMSKENKGQTTIFNAGLYGTLALVVICFVISVLFGVYQLATNPKGAIKFLIGFAVLAVVFFAVFTLAAPDTGKVAELVADPNYNVQSETISKLISAGLWTVLSLAGIAVVSFILSEIRNFFK